MGVYKTIIDDLYARIFAAKSALGIKNIYIGRRPTVEGRCDTPTVYIGFAPSSSIIEMPGNIVQNKKTAIVSVLIQVFYGLKNMSSTNILTNDTDKIDPAGFAESILDVIHKDTSGDISPVVGNTEEAFQSRIDFLDIVGNIQPIDITIPIQAAHFWIHNRAGS